jgi:hypothetical protein
MAHPAKYSSKLIRRIYQHVQEEGWVKPGDNVIDPFGGVALGALDAVRLGLNWYGVELEAKFHGLGNQNIDLWDSMFNSMPNWGSAHLLQGDSRKLMEVLKLQAVGAVSSPPYADSINSGTSSIDWEKAGRPDRLVTNSVAIQGANGREERYGSTPGQLGAMKDSGFEAAISSPPFLQSEGGTHTMPKGMEITDPGLLARHAAGNKSANGYGTSEGQLSSMREGGFDAAVSSPPFNVNKSNAKHGETKGFHSYDKNESYNRMKRDYVLAESDGNIRNLPMNKFDAVVSSPPYEGEVVRMRSSHLEIGRTTAKGMSRTPGMTAGVLAQEKYGDAAGQLGNDSGDDFWLAARTIVEQVYLALAPGGHAVWVVKDYVKNKQIVPFSDQWRQLCEAVGFVTLHEHHAMLVHHKGTQHTLEGGVVEYKTESKSFFRRLAEKKGSPRIDFETVFCMVKA